MSDDHTNDHSADPSTDPANASEPTSAQESAAQESAAADYLSRTESRLLTKSLRCCKGRVADITGSGMRMIVSPKDLPEVGDVQDYTFADKKGQVSVSGTVKWIRKGTAFTRRCEVGVEFLTLEPATRDAIIKLAVHGELGLNKDGQIDVGYPDLYKILGVPPYAKQDDIEGAYRKEAKIWHPDHNSAPNASECFDQIRKAYSVLSDESLRSSYDARFFSSGSHAA